MPQVGKKKFPYTIKGKADAKDYKMGEKMESKSEKKKEIAKGKKKMKKK